jgi:hypothetical protein
MVLLDNSAVMSNGLNKHKHPDRKVEGIGEMQGDDRKLLVVSDTGKVVRSCTKDRVR